MPFMPRMLAVLLTALSFSSAVLAQEPAPKHYTKRELHELDMRFDDFQKNIRDIQKQREALESAINEYDIKLKALAQSMEKTEEQIDFGSGVYSYDPNFIASTREVQATEMAYNLKSVDLLNDISSEHAQLTRVSEVMAEKYDKMKKIKSSGR